MGGSWWSVDSLVATGRGGRSTIDSIVNGMAAGARRRPASGRTRIRRIVVICWQEFEDAAFVDTFNPEFANGNRRGAGVKPCRFIFSPSSIWQGVCDSPCDG